MGVCRLVTERGMCGQLVVAAFVYRSFFPPSLLPFSFISSLSSVFPHFLNSFPRLVPMDVTQFTRYSPVSYGTSPV